MAPLNRPLYDLIFLPWDFASDLAPHHTLPAYYVVIFRPDCIYIHAFPCCIFVEVFEVS